MNDQSTSSLAAGTQTGVGIVSWGDYAEGLDAVYEPEPVYVEKQYTGKTWQTSRGSMGTTCRSG